MAYSKEEILGALRNVIDPDFGKDLVSLNMIEGIESEGKKISFTVVLTTPACPLKDKLEKDCIDAIHKFIDAEAEINVIFSSKVTS
ncbi:MAG: iron-sulfur cluster assembly protein [Bacteroidetes bacterium]|nr:iron-sulfur cluster assembly protein [Bacteroidota bacterium]